MTDKDQMESILNAGDLGHLGLSASGEVYVLPINYTYSAGRILFHCALEGRKLDMMDANPNVCFTVCRQEGRPAPHAGNLCSAAFESVICWGTARAIADVEERQAILNEFQARYDTPEKKREPISLERAGKCGAVEITVTRMTGRRVADKEKSAWQWEA